MPTLPRRLLQASLITLMAGCGDGTGPDPGSSIAEVRVSGDGVPVLVGERTLVQASLWDAEGNQLSLLDSLGRQIPGREISWSSADESKAQVSGQGPVQRTAEVTAIAPGSVAIHATAGGREGSIQVVVVAQAASLVLHPSRLGIVPTGESRIAYEFLDADGHPIDNFPRTPTWATSDPAVADFTDSEGSLIGVAPGTATITASGSGVEASIPIDVSLLTFTSVATAVRATCGVTTTGEVWCWGANLGSLFLAFPSVIPSPTPLRIEGGGTFAAISPSASVICGLGTDGTVYCWGDNVSGQLGRGSGESDMTPTPVAGGLSFSAVSSGEDFVCGLTLAGKPYCWGAGGQLGTGTADGSGVPVPVAGDLSLTSISTTRGNLSLFHQTRHTCGVAADGNAWCWGNNAHGELGDNSTTDRLSPVLVAGDLSFSSISTGVLHTCGIAGNQAYCWGDNSHGQLGMASTGELTPAPVAGGLTFSSVSAGFDHTCGITTGGVAYCWGQNELGQLGDGSNTASSSPVPVSGGHTFSSVSAGERYTCGITIQEVAYCWGGAEPDPTNPGPTGTGVNGSTVPLRVIGQP